MSQGSDARELNIVLPVHNEAESIASTLEEIHRELSPRVRYEFVISEDGSVDDTREILARLSQEFPMQLITSPARKGYSLAVRDAFKRCTAPWILFLDSDGQCLPSDYWALQDKLDEGGYDVVMGRRVNRSDSLLRRVMSQGFASVYQLLFRVPVRDPSCPFLLIRKEVALSVVDELGVFREGFWWEFVARVHRKGYRITDLPITHRPRAAGETKVYHLSKLPGIGFRHFTGLFVIWWQTRDGAARNPQGS
jgi:glycosyltransferase involved in cell wall biosynthesis